MWPALHPSGDHQASGAPRAGLARPTRMICGFGWLLLWGSRRQPILAIITRSLPGCAGRGGSRGRQKLEITDRQHDQSRSTLDPAPRSAEHLRLHGQVDAMGLHLARHTHGVHMTMKVGLARRPRPGPQAPRARTPGLPRVPPAHLDLTRGDGAGWAEPPNPVVTLTAVPDPLARPFPTRPSLPGATRPAVVPLPPAQGGHRMLALRSTPGPGSGASVFARPGASQADVCRSRPGSLTLKDPWRAGGGGRTTAGRVAPNRDGLVQHWRASASGTAARVTTGFGSSAHPTISTTYRVDGSGVDPRRNRPHVRDAVRPGPGTARPRDRPVRCRAHCGRSSCGE